ncbi:hypothetical protein H4R24_004410 [Coemansia sp. RSA 988]|nr:hypothetical protein H4R24_004410 [Coemansia sp. RSA 988]
MVRYQSPIPRKGLRRMLIEQGFHVLCINEFRTSKLCPYCREGQLEKFLDVDNPRPHRRTETPVIQSHAVLRCNNGKCKGRVANPAGDGTVPRILNRDLAACMNFKHTVDGLREHGIVLRRFRRTRRAGDVSAAAPDDGPPTRRQRTE